MIRLDTADTIVAISSPAGPGIRSIVRLSGPESRAIVADIATCPPTTRPTLSWSWPIILSPIDDCPEIPARFQYWRAGRSYTGQEMAELHLDVPNVLAEIVLRRCVAAGARPAEPGEFTLRAFLAGRIDLTRAEAVSGIFQARTTEQLQVALDQLAGGLGQHIERLRSRLLDLTAWLEATLDFVEETDVDPISRNFVALELRGFAHDLAKLCELESARDRPAATRRVVLAGRPNAGKSHLFNALCGTAGRALVSPIAGTTRDYLEAPADLGSHLVVTLVDTAGEYETVDAIDSRSQSLGRRERLMADLFLICVPADEPSSEVATFDRTLPANVPRIVVRTKSDLFAQPVPDSPESILVSAASGRGLDRLRSAIREQLDALETEIGPVVAGTRVRASEALRNARQAIERASATMATGGGDELVAIDLRAAVEALDVVTGRDATEEMLDRIFSRFCIGK